MTSTSGNYQRYDFNIPIQSSAGSEAFLGWSGININTINYWYFALHGLSLSTSQYSIRFYCHPSVNFNWIDASFLIIDPSYQ
jgi:hypothetical protein